MRSLARVFLAIVGPIAIAGALLHFQSCENSRADYGIRSWGRAISGK